MRSVMSRVKLLDRQVVDSDKLNAEVSEIFGTVGREIGIVPNEPRGVDEARIACANDDSLVVTDVVLLELICANGHGCIVDGDENRRTHQAFERNLVDRLTVIEEMFRRVYVSAGVRPKRYS